ncbi:MAG: hypothetical protein L6Q95_13425 [Planctomycetes bacterium]|nr:hypothetical protein [Planctomycetota bacterium]
MNRLVAVLALLPSAALGGDDLPEGPGLAARYPGDLGIAKDRAVLLAEDFEAGTIEDLGKRWTEVGNKDQKPLAWSDLRPEASSGRRSLQITATLGEDTGGHLFAPLAKGVDCAFARFYVRFAEDADYIHHFVHMGGMNPQTRWPNPQAGTRPKGDDRFSVGIEPWGDRGRAEPPGLWNFYPYWHEMRISADGRYWGNGIRPVEDQPAPRARWQCVEFMIKLNKPEERDGELALWLDGKLEAHVKKGSPRGPWTGMGFRLLAKGGEPFEGFSWRTTEELKVSCFWLLHYVTGNAARQNGVAKPNRVNRVWFDDVVVATGYIGPIRAR